MRLRLASCALVLFACPPLVASQAAGSIDLKLIPSSATVGAGQTFLVDVVIDAKSDKPTAANLFERED